MYMAYRAPHSPLQAPQELVDKYLPRYDDLESVESNRVKGLIREKVSIGQNNSLEQSLIIKLSSSTWAT